MGVAVLHPQNHFVNDPLFPRNRKQRLSQPHAKPPTTKAKPSSGRAHQNRPKKSPTKSLGTSPPPAPPLKGLVMGQVRILKRGEEVAATATATATATAMAVESKVETEAQRSEEVAGGLSPGHELARARTQKAESGILGSGPDQLLAGFYAGTAFITSPPPSSVPMPAFFTRKTGGMEGFVDPTSDLRRLLRLD